MSRARLPNPPEVEYNADDIISPLPDEVLISILSRLPLKDASKTSILARRWTNLWTWVANLQFVDEDAKSRIIENPKSRTMENCRFVNRVNRVIRQHKRPTLDTMKICFDLDKFSKSAIDNWIMFALSKSVEELELDFSLSRSQFDYISHRYVLPPKFFKNTRSSSSSLSSSSSSKPIRTFKIIPSTLALRVIRLRSVSVSDDTLSLLLLSCPLLESLTLHDSRDSVDMKVCGQSLKLKYLKLAFCDHINSLEIRSTNLVTLRYSGLGIKFDFQEVPMLHEISLGTHHAGVEISVLQQLACCFNQLEILNLAFSYPELRNLKIPDIGQLPKLRQFKIQVSAWYDECLLEFTNLMKLCPIMEKFVLQLMWGGIPPIQRREVEELEEFLHESLQVVEILGYFGGCGETELLKYFIWNAPSLKKIIIHPVTQVVNVSLTEEDRRDREYLRSVAMEKILPIIAPTTIKLVIM